MMNKSYFQTKTMLFLWLLIALFFLFQLQLMFSFSLDIDGLEFYFIRLTQRIFMHQPLYPNPEILPFDNCLYTPIYPYLLKFIYSFFNVDFTNDIYKMYVVGRFFSFVFVLVQLYYFIKLIRLFTSSNQLLLIVVCLYLYLLSGHIFAIRPDSLRLLFFTVFLYSLIRYLYFNSSIKYFTYSLFAAVLAVFSKQDIMVHIGVALLLCLFLASEKRKYVLLFGVYFGLICLVFLLLLYLSFGKYIISNLFYMNLQKTTDLFKSINVYFALYSIIRATPFLFFIYYNYKAIKKVHENRKVYLFFIFYGIFLFVYAHLSMLRVGANLNYTYELIIIMLLQFILFTQLYKTEIENKNKLFKTGTLAYLILCVAINMLVFRQRNLNKDYIKMNRFEYFSMLMDRSLIQSKVKDGYVFFPNPKYAVMFAKDKIITTNEMHLGRFIRLYTPFYAASKLTGINTQIFDNAFLSGQIKYILIKDDEKSKQFVKEYYPAYKRDYAGNFFLLYKYDNNNNK
ncbi:MAG: hypothetical protein R2739_06540 [Chitinophagales bacterium]